MARLLPLSPGLELEQAEKLRRTSIATDFERGVLLEDEVMGVKMPPTKFLLQNLITEKSINLINGFREMGKSWLAMMIANEVTWGETGKVGPWRVGESVHTLLVDGEMPLSMVQDRLARMNKGRRKIRYKDSLLFIYPESYAYRIGLKRSNLLDPKWREAISDVVHKHSIGLLILDNLSSLAPGIDENVKMPFDPINRWMLELRFYGTTIILTHHVGKSGEQRGTTAHEDHLDTSLVLNRPANYKRTDGCKFVCRVTKDRSMVTEGKQFTLQLCENKDGGLEFGVVADIGIDLACRELSGSPGLTEDEALDKGISHSTFHRAKDRLGLKKRKYEWKNGSNLNSEK